MIIINSKQNQLIKYALSIKEKKGIVKHNECLVESEKLVFDLVNSNHKVSAILCSENKVEKFSYILNQFKGKIYYISEQISKHLADSVTPSGIFAFVGVPNNPTFDKQSNYLVLDNLQDPTNVGALIRSAKAFGYNNICILGGFFPYTYKVIRSSMGYVFDVNIINMTVEQLKSLNLPIYVGDMKGKDVSLIDKPKSPFAVAVGNEGQGISQQLFDICSNVVKIPMQNGVESLNASVSGGILMYNLLK